VLQDYLVKSTAAERLMRTLNRPMFRYGGPIKEGIMSGIREPKRNGGSMMGNNEGPRRAALVGNPIYPNVDGRTNHLFPAKKH
jgi:hypothetical protein